PTVTLPCAPGLLEGQRGQVLGRGGVAHTVPEEVVDAGQLLPVDRVPVDRVTFGGADQPSDEPRTTHAALIYGGGGRVSQRSPRSRSSARGVAWRALTRRARPCWLIL